MSKAAEGDALARAHDKLLADKSLQFDLTGIEPPKPPPEWLESVIRFLSFISPVLKVVFWVGVVAVVGLIVFFIARELIRLRWRGRTGGAVVLKAPVEEWRPEAAAARTLLEDADRLAAAGRFAEAVHLLLFRSIEDLQGLRPQAIKPALTSRDIARLEALPASARPAFMHIAEVVERSFFGGRAVDAAAFADCRKAYEAFAFPGTWS